MSRFDTTQWSVVAAAGSSHPARARPALNVLCQAYWRPLHQYLRHSGCTDDDARDLTQSFLASLIERGSVATVSRAQGRFRAFLLASLRHFLLNDIATRRALKRGGGTTTVSIDAGAADVMQHDALTERNTPERVFDRQWAITVLSSVTEQLRAEWVSAGKGYEFDMLAPALAGERSSGGYQAMAESIGSTEGAVKVMVHRLRRRYRTRLHEAIADTVASPDEVDDEIRYLMRALAG